MQGAVAATRERFTVKLVIAGPLDHRAMGMEVTLWGTSHTGPTNQQLCRPEPPQHPLT